jgi:hypothetical protein
VGYPMSYQRVVMRNHLTGGYARDTPDVYEVKQRLVENYGIDPGDLDELVQGAFNQARAMIAGDMRRLEADSVDERHLQVYADEANIVSQQAWKVLSKFFAS